MSYEFSRSREQLILPNMASKKKKKYRGRKDREEKKEAKKAALKKEGSHASVEAKMTTPLRAALKCQNKMYVI